MIFRTQLFIVVAIAFLSACGQPRHDESSRSQIPTTVDAEAQVKRVAVLIAKVRNPKVELFSLQTAQQGEDLFVRGTGRNVGECVLASLILRAKMGDEIDGILVRVGGKPTFEIPIGEDFSFELPFYGTKERRPVTIWFNLDDLADFNFKNDPVVPIIWQSSVARTEVFIE